MEPEDIHQAGVASPEVTAQSRLANLIQRVRAEEINRSLPLSTPQQEELRTTTPLKTPHTCTHSQHLKLNMSKTALIFTTKPIIPPSLLHLNDTNTHLHPQAKNLSIILLSSCSYFQYSVHQQTLPSIPSRHASPLQ